MGATPLTGLSDGEVSRRFDRLEDYLDAWGDLILVDIGRNTDRRLLEFRLEAPGWDLPTEVRTQYREYYQRDGASWNIEKYTYEYHDLRVKQRLAFHLHDLGSSAMVPHAHCGSDDQDVEAHAHLRAIPYDLREAHSIFMKLYAADEPPPCRSYLPLEIARDR